MRDDRIALRGALADAGNAVCENARRRVRSRRFEDGMGLVASISDNPLYKPYEGSGEEVNIIGRIRWFAREM